MGHHTTVGFKEVTERWVLGSLVTFKVTTLDLHATKGWKKRLTKRWFEQDGEAGRPRYRPRYTRTVTWTPTRA